MTQFEKMTTEEIICDICGELMIALYGGGWDNDRMICNACGAEIVFPTTTVYINELKELKDK